jgi:hypothetical protein
MTKFPITYVHQPELSRQAILSKDENYSFDMSPTYRIHELLKDTRWVTSPYSIYLWVKQTNDLLWHECFEYTIDRDETSSLEEKVRYLKDDNDGFGESNVGFWMDFLDREVADVGKQVSGSSWTLKKGEAELNSEARSMMDELLGYCFIYRERIEKENAEWMAELDAMFSDKNK